MTIELKMLALSIVLGFAHVLIAVRAVTRQYGSRWNMGPRDEVMPPLNPLAGRLDRARRNFLETFPFFAAAVLIAHVAGRDGLLTALGVQLYFWARLVYLPLYAFGIPRIRTLVWIVAMLGILLILVALV
jgi:uncharacterized MAPEG superfamily protein